MHIEFVGWKRPLDKEVESATEALSGIPVNTKEYGEAAKGVAALAQASNDAEKLELEYQKLKSEKEKAKIGLIQTCVDTGGKILLGLAAIGAFLYSDSEYRKFEGEDQNCHTTSGGRESEKRVLELPLRFLKF